MLGITITIISILFGMFGSSYAEKKITEYFGTILESDYRKLFYFWLWFGTIGIIVGAMLVIYGI